MKTIKHLFTALLLLCATVATAQDFEVDGIYYDKTELNYSVEVVSGNYFGAVVIPETVTYEDVTYWVTSIGNSAFDGCFGLTSVEIPNSVTSIGGLAFYGCRGLTSIEIPNSVTSIGGYAFYNCSGLTSVEIPNSVTSIGNFAFCNCTGLESITVAADNSVYDSREGCNAIIETASNTLVVGCKNTVIPNSVTSIEVSAFYYCTGLTSIEIPNSFTSIGYQAFLGCSGLTSIEIPNSVTSIGERAFKGCSSLTSIEIPNSVTSIGDQAFYNCSGLTSVEIPNSVTSIGGYAFYSCSGLTSVTIGNSVTSIGDCAFSDCSGLESITVAADNSVYDSREGCNAIIGTASNTLVAGCKNTVIPNSVTSIGASAFRGCSGLTSIEIPNSVTSIGEGAFRGCSGLTSIEIPNSVTSIGENAFRDCTGLTSIISHIPAGKLFSLNSNAFNNVDKTNCTLYVPYGTKGEYAATDGWREFENIVELPDAFDLTVTSAGYASLYLSSAVEIPLDVEVYTATAVEGDLLKMQQVTGILPANTGAIVKADAGTYSFIYSDETPTAIEGNLLLGTTTDTYIKPTAGTAAYVLSQVDGIVGMYLAELNGEGLFLNNANKAYMLLGDIKIEDGEIDTSAPGTQLSAGYRFDFGGTTGVEKVEMRKEKVEIYDLQGRRVEHPTKGLYIVNGRVMLVK